MHELLIPIQTPSKSNSSPVAVKKSDGGGGFKVGVPTDLKADVMVSKDRSGSYKTVQEEVNAAPENGSGKRFVIRIKAGVYEETMGISLAKKNVVFLGDGFVCNLCGGNVSSFVVFACSFFYILFSGFVM